MDQDETWHTRRPRPCHIVLHGDPPPHSPKGAQHPKFLAHICCGQMAGWIKMPLGREVGLDPSDIVLDGDPAPLPKKGAEPPIFGPCLLWPNGWWIKIPLGMEVGLDPSDIVTQGPSSPLPKKGAEPPNFRPMSTVATRLDGLRCHLVWR